MEGKKKGDNKQATKQKEEPPKKEFEGGGWDSFAMTS